MNQHEGILILESLFYINLYKSLSKVLRNFPDCSASDDPTKEITQPGSVLVFMNRLNNLEIELKF